MKAKDYKIGDVPENVCMHSPAFIIKFRFLSKTPFKSWGKNKCIKCDKFTEEEIEVLRKQPQYYSEEFIKGLTPLSTNNK